MMIDFSSCKTFINTYQGADIKLPILYQGERYMLKFGNALTPDPKDPDRASIINVPVSEYLGSHVFELMRVSSQHTLLGTYEGRNVVACKDFIHAIGADIYELVEFNKLETSFFGSSSSIGRTPEYENVINIFENHPALEPIRKEAEKRYWEMFIGDALAGNFDRHAGNWGYILNKRTNELEAPAPIYDCGATFYPRLSEEAMGEELAISGKIEERIFAYPKAALMVHGRKPSYHDFLLSAEGERCREVLLCIYDRIDLDSIKKMITDTPGLSATQRAFYSELIQTRHEKIITPAYEMALACSLRT